MIRNNNVQAQGRAWATSAALLTPQSTVTRRSALPASSANAGPCSPYPWVNRFGNIADDPGSQVFQKMPQHRRGGKPVDVIIAIDDDRLPAVTARARRTAATFRSRNSAGGSSRLRVGSRKETISWAWLRPRLSRIRATSSGTACRSLSSRIKSGWQGRARQRCLRLMKQAP